MKYKIEAVHDQPMLLGECPTWHAIESALYWVDIDGLTVNRLHPASGKYTTWKMGYEPSAIAPDINNQLIVSLRNGLVRLKTTDGTITELTPAPYDPNITRFNDGRVDPAGRFWVGTLYEPRDKPAAEMYVFEHDRLRRAWSGGMTNSNGLAWSPDGRTMYHVDTTTHRIDSYDFDPATGTPSNHRTIRIFASDKNAPDYGGRPDGAAMDSEGGYWVAMYEGACVLRLSPNGDILQKIELPALCPTAVAFGGPDLKTLYVTSASKGRSDQEKAKYPLTGMVMGVRVDVPGHPQPEYQP